MFNFLSVSTLVGLFVSAVNMMCALSPATVASVLGLTGAM